MNFKTIYRTVLKDVKKEGVNILVPYLSTTTKLKKNGISSFSLVADINCPGASDCRDFCYAKEFRYKSEKVMRVRIINFLSSLRPEFIEHMTCMIRLSKCPYIRLHDSGDFYNQAYVNKWVEIIGRFPNILFYAYTKSLNLNLSKLFTADNFTLIQSEGGAFDQLINPKHPVAKVFKTVELLKASGYTDGTENEVPALSGKPRIGFVVHGSGKWRY